MISGSRPATRAGTIVLCSLLLVAASDPVVAPDRTAGVRAGRAPAGTVHREAWAMGTRVRISVEGTDRARAASFAEEVLREIERVESLLSTWRPDSELSRLNGAPPGTRVELSPEVGHWLAEAANLSRRTGGAFDPAVGALIDAWDMRGAGRRPSAEALAGALEASGPTAFSLDDGNTAVRNRAGARLDAGAFGKGAGLAAVARLAADASVSRILVDLGGQLWIGAPSPQRSDRFASFGGRAPVPVEVAHPYDREQGVRTLHLSGRSSATSGASERWIEVDGERYGHILDPRTGRPLPAWGSVTVVSADPLEADALATALFVMGPEQGFAWAERHDVAALFLSVPTGSAELRITSTTSMEPWLE